MKLSSSDLSCLVPDTIEMSGTGSGKLDGKTFVAKDIFSIKGHIASFGHPRWRETHQIDKTTSPVITKLLDSGAELKGLAKLDQLAGSLSGNIGEGSAPLNPLYPDRFTGGSSSGSASAVAGGLVDFSIGTDTAGSVRVPAAVCGLYGIRPTHGSITSEGLISLAASFDTVGIFSKDPALLEDVYDVLSEIEYEQDPITTLLVPGDICNLIDIETKAAVIEAAKQLSEKHQMIISNIDLTEYVNQDTSNLFSRLQNREAWNARPNWLRENKDYLAPDLRARMAVAELRASDPQEIIQRDLEAWKRFRASIQEIVQPGAALILPVTGGLPPLKNSTEDQLSRFRNTAFRFNAVCSLSGLPEVVFPTKYKSYTYGVGLVGCKNSDKTLLDIVK